MEIWKAVAIEGYEHYEVSTMGRVRNTKNGKLKKPQTHVNGYLYMTLYDGDGGKRNVFVHRLVGLTFIENPENKSEINHIDENKQNNCVENLEWCTRSENVNYGTRTEKQAKALSVKVVQLKDGEPIKIWDSMNQAKRECGFNVGNISKCCRNLMSCYKGFEWKYLSDYASEQTVVH